MLEYKGYVGKIAYDDVAEVLYTLSQRQRRPMSRV